MIKVANKKWALMIMMLILLLVSCISIPTALAESNVDTPLLREQVDSSTYKISANTEHEFTDAEKIKAVNDLEIFTSGRVSKTDEESLAYYARITASNYLQIRPMFCCEIDGIDENVILNRDQYFPNKAARMDIWDSPNGYMEILTNIWVSNSNNGYKRIDIENICYWLKNPTTWNRSDYVIYNWGNKPNYLPNNAKGDVLVRYTYFDIAGDIAYDEVINDCTEQVGIDSSYIAFEGILQGVGGTVEMVMYRSEISLESRENFNFTIAYYHDQGFLSYSSFLDKISVSAGIVSVPLSGFLCSVKEYRAPEPFYVQI